MDPINQVTDRRRLRDALVAFGLERRRTHWVTLNTHRDVRLDVALQYLRRWRVEIMRRLHGRRFFELDEAERISYFGAPHFTGAGEPHFHLAFSIPPSVLSNFCRNAAARWKAIVPSGTCHIEVIDQEANSQARVIGYALRAFNPRYETAFVDSRIYR